MNLIRTLIFTLSALLALPGCSVNSNNGSSDLAPALGSVPASNGPASKSVTGANGSIFEIVFFPDHSIKIIDPKIGNRALSGDGNAICKSVDPIYVVGAFDTEKLASEQIGLIGEENGRFVLGTISEKITTVHCVDQKNFRPDIISSTTFNPFYWFHELKELKLAIGDRQAQLTFIDNPTSIANDTKRRILFEKICSQNGYSISATDKFIAEMTAAPSNKTSSTIQYDPTTESYHVVDSDQLSQVKDFYSIRLPCSKGQLLKNFLSSHEGIFNPVYQWDKQTLQADFTFGRSLRSENFTQYRGQIRLQWPWKPELRSPLLLSQSNYWAPRICDDGLPISFSSISSTNSDQLAIARTSPALSFINDPESNSVLTYKPRISRGTLDELYCLRLPPNYVFKYELTTIEKTDSLESVLVKNARIERNDGREVHYFQNGGTICYMIGFDRSRSPKFSSLLKNPNYVSYSIKFVRSGFSSENYEMEVDTLSDGTYVNEVNCRQIYED